MHKQIVEYAYNGTLLSSKMEKTANTCDNTDEPHRDYAE